MLFTPLFGGCKYTNYFLFINKKAEFQYFGPLIFSKYILYLSSDKKHSQPWIRTGNGLLSESTAR